MEGLARMEPQYAETVREMGPQRIPHAFLENEDTQSLAFEIFANWLSNTKAASWKRNRLSTCSNQGTMIEQ